MKKAFTKVCNSVMVGMGKSDRLLESFVKNTSYSVLWIIPMLEDGFLHTKNYKLHKTFQNICYNLSSFCWQGILNE